MADIQQNNDNRATAESSAPAAAGSTAGSQGKLILVCGPSGSGKSTLAEALHSSRPDSALIQQDHYFSRPFLPYKERSDDSFEGPAHVNWAKLRQDVKQKLAEAPLVIVEGHILTVDDELSNLSDLCVLLQCPMQVCKARRLTRRQRPPEELLELETYIDRFVWPSFEKYGQPALERLEENCKNSGKFLFKIDTTESSHGTHDHVAQIVDMIG
eukprot:TRINITY_DN66148_c0_g1_i1.p1 TRINITY_DN66148_c0_g1~~TRINITY_DN66148_c0_g1_i1.p1  ORF type:complete len:213 (-),score=40.42 TRINITY_DN66148_c0_g1_i1:276-914(-)